MDEHPKSRSPSNKGDRIRNGFVMVGLISGAVLTLGWWMAIAAGLYHAVG